MDLQRILEMRGVNTEILCKIPKFYLLSRCRNCVSTTYSQQEIRWNFAIFIPIPCGDGNHMVCKQEILKTFAILGILQKSRSEKLLLQRATLFKKETFLQNTSRQLVKSSSHPNEETRKKENDENLNWKFKFILKITNSPSKCILFYNIIDKFISSYNFRRCQNSQSCRTKFFRIC